VQPLLRAVGRLVIGAIALMSALSSLGFNIAPLLASAGVVGIAVGFGAQTLVRDLFSGASYLIEDVFRIGDYIEGGNAKGTVERIIFRTVTLRHRSISCPTARLAASATNHATASSTSSRYACRSPSTATEFESW
jgi:small-conductance mechanosensitive channel